MLEQIEFNITVSPPISTNKQMEPNRDRFETREVFVFNDLYGIDRTKWDSIKEFVKVVRTTDKKGNTKSQTVDTSYYISSKSMSAQSYNNGIRAHWSIENSLHYVKDVTFAEDASLIRTGSAPTNFSIIRNIAINLFGRLNFVSFKQAIRMIGGDIQAIGNLLE